ncbi:hypothetical protein BAC2_01002 [uncultured bacterium]|nr:hypothetical protein BAC2_01002 [uncultured bacterium]
MFRSKRRILLVAVLALVLVVGVMGFAFTRGYFMRFIVGGIELSRDEYFALAEAASGIQTAAYCVQGEFSFSEGYVIRCFDPDGDLTALIDR